jgi:trehalose 6-phosphate phosphatase
MTRPRRSTPHLFEDWGRIARRIRENQHLAMFLDFDGTLVRIAPLPNHVRLEDETRDILRKLAAHHRVTLAVISGRQRAELQRHIGLRKMKYMGLYGWECNGRKTVAFPDRVALVRALLSLLAELRSYPGVWIEPKRSTFSVHLKDASGDTKKRVIEHVKKRVKTLHGTLKVMANLRDVEVAPVSIGDKGVAVRKFLDQPAMRGALPIYFGDDFSDEPAFAAARDGISVLVGKRRPTRAQYCVRGPVEVAEALSRMEKIIR